PGAALRPYRDARPLLQDAERDALLAILQANHWHLTRVAEHLGISRNTLYRKLRKHGITRGD
ncbi:sigma-54-dependent Fis family transcriptional regulator, partial [Pseudomonas sp. S37]|uniref:helix-turn-helix domain-containing protein n=1 Tax=Pseudomonas sp. S37 TaxID=2767449 RepID=UPI0019149553